MVDEVFEKIQDKNKMGQKFHRCTSFRQEIDIRRSVLPIIIVPRSAARDEAIAYVRAATAAHRV